MGEINDGWSTDGEERHRVRETGHIGSEWAMGQALDRRDAEIARMAKEIERVRGERDEARDRLGTVEVRLMSLVMLAETYDLRERSQVWPTAIDEARAALEKP